VTPFSSGLTRIGARLGEVVIDRADRRSLQQSDRPSLAMRLIRLLAAFLDARHDLLRIRVQVIALVLKLPPERLEPARIASLDIG